MNSYAYSCRMARDSGSSFYPAFFFLPSEQRNALCAVYTFSRLVDDIVDQGRDLDLAQQGIARWKERLLHCYQKTDPFDHPLLPELADAIDRFQIPKNLFLDLLTGVEMDLVKQRYETFQELEVYCYHVAGVVGLLCNQIFGVQGEPYRQYALRLGTAFQLTNILRDIRNDLERGRIYLPLEDLRFFSYPVEDLVQRTYNEQFLRLMRFEAARARAFFEQARGVLSAGERKRLMAAGAMARCYEAILGKLEKQRFPSLKKKVTLFPLTKVWILATTWLGAQCSA